MIGWAHASLDLPAGLLPVGGEFWAAALGWTLGEPWPSYPEFRSVEPPDGDGFLTVQTVSGPPAVHVDLETDDLPGDTDRLTGLGAAQVRTTEHWVTLTSPGGFSFCLVRSAEHGARPGPVGAPGRRTRLAQVCLDLPDDRHDEEVAFWRSVTGWRLAPLRAPEFTGRLVPPAGSSLQLLLHRLGADDPGGRTRAHLDLGCENWEAEAERLVELGATRLWEGDGWITLRDPAGLLFCASETSPDAP